VAETNPMAAATLRQVLRVTEALPVDDGLVVESLAYSTLLGGPEFEAWRSARPRREPPEPSGPPVRLARDGDRLEIVLDRPERRNAYSRHMRDALVEALTLVDLDPSIGEVVLRGEGPAFCSGGDLDEFGTTPDPVTGHVIRTTRSAAALIHRNRDRITVHVHGACVGAGIELPSFAGRVVAAPDAFFLLPEVAMGLIPGAGGTVGIPRRIGRERTEQMALAGERVDAATALAWGLVDEVA
jgi:enoyl-CoA hydratase/carnithine racemase